MPEPRDPDGTGASGPDAIDPQVLLTPDGRLRGAERAIVAEEKLTRYALDPEHPRGRGKARVFATALGFDRTNWEDLRQHLLAGARHLPAEPIGADEHGVRFRVDVPVTGPNGAVTTVRTGWICAVTATGTTSPPRLVTLVVLRKRQPG